jgi:hypothetical protein
MASKRTAQQGAAAKAVTADRAARLYKLLHLLGTGGRTRAFLIRRLKLDVRGFYRDLELLRAAGIEVPLHEEQYRLEGSLQDAVARLPFPDPRLTLGEATQVAKGRSAAHRKLREQIEHIQG